MKATDRVAEPFLDHLRMNARLQLQRRKRWTADEQAELDGLNRDRVVTPPVAVLSNKEN